MRMASIIVRRLVMHGEETKVMKRVLTIRKPAWLSVTYDLISML